MKSLLQSPIADVLQGCPLCGATSRRLFPKHSIWIRACNRCQHRFAEILTSPDHVEQIYSNQYFFGGNDGYPNYVAESGILRQHGLRYGRILARYMKPGSVLDVGAAAGFILQGLIDSGWQGRGLEPNAQMAEYGRAQLHLEITTGSLEQFQDNHLYDLVCMIQVVAHFFDIQQAFSVASQRTKPGGYWLIETWNRNSLMARLLGKNWHEYSPPSVLHWFSPSGLKQVAAQHGFREIARGRPQKWIRVDHAKSLLHYKLENSAIGRAIAPLLGVIPDNLCIPYPSEDLFWMLLQKS